LGLKIEIGTALPRGYKKRATLLLGGVLYTILELYIIIIVYIVWIMASWGWAGVGLYKVFVYFDSTSRLLCTNQPSSIHIIITSSSIIHHSSFHNSHPHIHIHISISPPPHPCIAAHPNPSLYTITIIIICYCALRIAQSLLDSVYSITVIQYNT